MCPVQEARRLVKTLERWKTEFSANFDTDGAPKGSLETINNLIEKTRRVAHGIRHFENYRLQILAVTSKKNLSNSQRH